MFVLPAQNTRCNTSVLFKNEPLRLNITGKSENEMFTCSMNL